MFSHLNQRSHTVQTSQNFDMFNLVYLGCAGVYHAKASHLVAFCGKKGSTWAGLTAEQSTEDCKALSDIPIWMGTLAKIKVRPISLH